MTSRRRVRRLAPLAVGLSVLLLPATALAESTASWADGKLTWKGDDGRSKIYFRWHQDERYIEISGDDVKPGPGCVSYDHQNGDRGARCPDMTSIDFQAGGGDDELISNFVPDLGPGRTTVDLGAGNDSFEGFGGRFIVHGRTGDDFMGGGDGDDELHGDEGVDGLVGYHGRDKLYGGPGDDLLSGDGRTRWRYADELDGGEGHDRVADYTSLNGSTEVAHVSLDGEANDGYKDEGDQILTIEGAEAYSPLDFTGDDGPNVALSREFAHQTTLKGLGGDDELEGNIGKDTIVGGAGRDTIRGDRQRDCQKESCTGSGGGDDTIDVRDGEVDKVTCGPGNDKVTADHDDDVAADCETVDRTAKPQPQPTATATPPPGATATPAPIATPAPTVTPGPKTVKLGLAGKAPKLAAALAKGLRVTVPGRPGARISVRALRNGRTVAKGSGIAGGSGSAVLTVRFDARARKALKKARSVKLLLVAGALNATVTLKK